LFHASTWVFVAIGLTLLWRVRQDRQAPRSGYSFLGLLLAGWGLFNLIEGVIDHQLLGIHHVRPGDHWLLYDLGFLALGAALLLGGWALYRSGLGSHDRTVAGRPRPAGS
jgi:uncharacterized membrane protein